MCSRNYCGNTKIIKYHECVSVFWQDICAVIYCHLQLAWLYSIFPYYLIHKNISEKVTENKMCFDFFLYKCCLKYFSF